MKFRAYFVASSSARTIAALAVVGSSSALVLHCSSDGSATTDAGPDTSAPDSGVLTVSPSTAKVLTCDTQQFTASGPGSTGGTWSVAPTSNAGKVSATGLYSAPTAMGALGNDAGVANATVSYTATGGASASGAVTYATAFLGTRGQVPIGMNGNAVPTKPYDKTFAANGKSVYAAVPSTTDPVSHGVDHVDIYASTDGGNTWGMGPASSYHTGNLGAGGCAELAVDPVNANLVYLVYYAGHDDSTSNTGATMRLAVSTDGAKTFPTEYIIADDINSMADLICPDVAAPSADHVIVAGVTYDSKTSTHWVATFASANRGASLGPVGGFGVQPDGGNGYFSTSDTNKGSASVCTIYDDGSGGTPRVYGSGTGKACITFQYAAGPKGHTTCDGNGPGQMAVQCSADNGATWTPPSLFGSANVQNTQPTAAVSPGGNVAVVYAQSDGKYDRLHVVISKDLGKTWSAPILYPADSISLDLASLAWEGDNILWVTGRVEGNAPSVLVDKTCDFGATWSGAVNLPDQPAGLALTGSGVAAGSFISSNQSDGPALHFTQLAP